jgi:hypothetical protein
MLIGVTAAAAAWLASIQPSPARWLLVWVVELALAGVIAVGMSARKAHALGVPMRSYAGRKLILAFTPPMVAGGLLTAAMVVQGDLGLVPGIWLALYGTGVMAAGTYSVRVVPMMGAAFIVLSAVALLAPINGDLLLGLGLGGLHLLFGLIIWRGYGG